VSCVLSCTVQYSTVQYRAVKYNAVAVQYSAESSFGEDHMEVVPVEDDGGAARGGRRRPWGAAGTRASLSSCGPLGTLQVVQGAAARAGQSLHQRYIRGRFDREETPARAGSNSGTPGVHWRYTGENFALSKRLPEVPGAAGGEGDRRSYRG